MSDGMVKEKLSSSLGGVIKCGNLFGAFFEIVDYDDNVCVVIARGEVTFYEVNDPLTKWAGSND